jgi:ketosteroid isomerase-like protein
MSQENVEIVRETWGGLMSGDIVALSVFDPNVIYENDLLPDGIGETYHGIEGVVKAWALWAQPWENLQTDLEWVRGAGDDVVSCHLARMRGKASGITTKLRYAYLWRFRANKVVYCKAYRNPNEALEAVGLSE